MHSRDCEDFLHPRFWYSQGRVEAIDHDCTSPFVDRLAVGCAMHILRVFS